MNLQENAENILYGTAAVIAAAAVTGFAAGNSNLSPATQLGVFIAGFAVFLLTGKKLEQPLNILSYGLAAINYVAFSWFAVSRFSLNTDQLFIFLGFTSLVLAGTASLMNRYTPSTRQTRLAVTAVILALLSITLVDITGPETSHTLNLENQATIEGPRDTPLGTLIIQNRFLLPRNAETPHYEACIYQNTTERFEHGYIQLSERPDTVPGNSLKNVKLTMNTRDNITGTFSVRKSESCPANLNENAILVTESRWD
jgi:hypothetical protein